MDHAQLHRARALDLPGRQATLRRTPEVASFWQANTALLEEAWAEWEDAERDRLPVLDETLIDPRLRAAVDAAWDDPTTEGTLADLWQPAAPDVHQAQFFDPARLSDLRAFLDAVADAQIPVRPPYGIVLNRRGAMLDPRSVGYLASPTFQRFYRQVVDRYFRPISRLLFAGTMGFDHQSFGFSITYLPAEDTSIRPHTDASTTTLNLNLNLPGETYEGSVVDFYAPGSGRPHPLRFAPGTAAIHRGHVAHAAHPITQGERTNLVLWLYGEQGRIAPRQADETPKIDGGRRWSLPGQAQDGYAPF